MAFKVTEGLVFLTDLSSFGRLTRGMALEELADLMERFGEITYRHVSEGGGGIVKYIGDSALGYFPTEKINAGIGALLAMQKEIETELDVNGHRTGVRIGAHYGPFVFAPMPPIERPDIQGETVNIAATLGSGGQSKHRDRFILTPEAFRKLDPETRTRFHKFTEPIVYLAER